MAATSRLSTLGGSGSGSPHPELAMRTVRAAPYNLDGAESPNSLVLSPQPDGRRSTRQLPRTPSRQSNMSEPTVGLNVSVSMKLDASTEILICPFGCTATGPSTQLACLTCGLVYCMACLRSDLGPMFTVTKMDKGKYMHKLVCADCGSNPRRVDIDQRPDWQTDVVATETKCKPVLPSVGPARQAEDRIWQQPDQRAWMTSLRSDSPPRANTPRARSATPNGRSRTPSGTSTPNGRTRSSPSEREPMPAVFDRLTSAKGLCGAHRQRFTPDMQGRGIVGRRDDNEMELLIAGLGQITRDIEPDMDIPTAPKERKLKRTVSASNVSSMDAYTDPKMLNGVYKRLVGYSPAQCRPPGEYELTKKAAQPFSVPPSVARLHTASKS